MAQGEGVGREPGRLGGLLNQLTKNVLEAALDAELDEHFGHEYGETPPGVNMSNETWTKMVLAGWRDWYFHTRVPRFSCRRL